MISDTTEKMKQKKEEEQERWRQEQRQREERQRQEKLRQEEYERQEKIRQEKLKREEEKRRAQEWIRSCGIEQIDKMDGFEFEQRLSNLFRVLGYKVSVTKKSGDAGGDLVIIKDGKKIVVQAKRY